MKSIKSNPYVYPYMPFYDLSVKEESAKFIGKKIITTLDLVNIVKSLPELKVFPKGNSTAEKILNLFLDDQIRFGQEEYILKEYKIWIEKLNYFINLNQPIQFSLLGFPFKMPVPLKTDRTLPDMGEVLSLKRLRDITGVIKQIYQKGAKITIFTEGVFGRFNEVSPKEYKNYKKMLDKFVKIFNWEDALSIIELEEMEKLDVNFEKRFKDKTRMLTELYDKKDANFMKKYLGAKESILRIVNTKILNIEGEILMDVYNEKISDMQASNKIKEVRTYMEQECHELLIKYLAYLMVRDDLDFIEKTIPHAITLSVSPKQGRLGIQPINNTCIRLPYHGVPAFSKNMDRVSIEYIKDIVRKPGNLETVFWEEDKENKPFYYILS